MEPNLAERRVPVYILLKHQGLLKHFQSFSENVSRCNFNTRDGWAVVGQGKTYIHEHKLEEYKPESLRGVTVLDLYYVTIRDTVILTEEQYADYLVVAGGGI